MADAWCEGGDPYCYDIFTASSVGDNALIDTLLLAGCDVNRQNRSGWTALMYSAYLGHYSTACLLLKNRANPGIQNSSGQTALMLSVRCGHVSICKAICDMTSAAVVSSSRGDVTGNDAMDLVDAQGHTALHHAVALNQADCVKVLLGFKPDLDVRDTTNGYSPLILATSLGLQGMVNLLIKHGAKTSVTDIRGKTAIDHADNYTPITQALRSAKKAEKMRTPPAAVTQSKLSKSKTVQSKETVHPSPVSTSPGSAGSVPQDPYPASVRHFLSQLGLHDYTGYLEAEEIDMAVLLQMNDSDLKDVGITKLGPRKKILNGIARIHSEHPVGCGNPMEQALSNYYKAMADELKRNLKKVYKENDFLLEEVETLKTQSAERKGLLSLRAACAQFVAKMEELKLTQPTSAPAEHLMDCQHLPPLVLQDYENLKTKVNSVLRREN